MTISGYYFGILKRTIRELTDGTGVFIEPLHISDETSPVDKIKFKINWHERGAVEPYEAEKFSRNLQKASEIAIFLNCRNFEVDYVKQENTTGRCVSDDIDLCKKHILNADTGKLNLLLAGLIPAQDEYEV